MSQPKQPLITVIMLNWNGKQYLDDCLHSIQAQSYPALQITVVDNGSSDGSPEYVKNHFPAVNIIRNNKNLGFGGGTNIGITGCTTDFLVILNNDASLHPDCIKELYEAISKDSMAGSCASRIMLKSENDRIDAAGIVVCPDGLAIGRGRMEPTADYLDKKEVFFASGCCALFRKTMLDDIGLFDEGFFAYAEDTDLGWRAQSRGWKTLYIPTAIVYHHHSGSTSGVSPIKAYLVERNRLCVAIKNFPLSLLVYGLWYTVRRYFWQAYGVLFSRGRAGDFIRQYTMFHLGIILLKAWLCA